MKRLFDIVSSLIGLVLLAPVIAMGILGILLSSKGPIFYVANRTGRHNKNFKMYKLRTMDVDRQGDVITSHNDPRVFKFGKLLRRFKVDELPQLYNILKGDMSVVGPRPEDPTIVASSYSEWMMETLTTRPGLTSVGSLFYYSCGEIRIDNYSPEKSYVENILPAKIALDRAYLTRANLVSDIAVIAQTLMIVVGFEHKPDERDIGSANSWVSRDTFEKLL